MSEVDLKKRAQELEQTLQLQLSQLKKDSETWLKVGAAVVAVGLLVSALAKRSQNKKSPTQPAADGCHTGAGSPRKKESTDFLFLSPGHQTALDGFVVLGPDQAHGRIEKEAGKVT